MMKVIPETRRAHGFDIYVLLFSVIIYSMHTFISCYII